MGGFSERDAPSESFMSAVDARPSVYPGDQLGGATMSSFQRMLAQFQGPGPEGSARQLQLLSITQEGNQDRANGPDKPRGLSCFRRSPYRPRLQNVRARWHKHPRGTTLTR